MKHNIPFDIRPSTARSFVPEQKTAGSSKQEVTQQVLFNRVDYDTKNNTALPDGNNSREEVKLPPISTQRLSSAGGGRTTQKILRKHTRRSKKNTRKLTKQTQKCRKTRKILRKHTRRSKKNTRKLTKQTQKCKTPQKILKKNTRHRKKV